MNTEWELDTIKLTGFSHTGVDLYSPVSKNYKEKNNGKR